MARLKLILHWIGLLPAALLCSWLLFVLMRASISISFGFSGVDQDNLVGKACLNFMPYMAQGGAFVYIAGRFSPCYNQVVAYLCSIIVICHAVVPFSIVLWVYGTEHLDWWGCVGAMAEIIGAVAIVIISYQEDDFFIRK